jgi:acetylornithine/N-succinyldiaminopimelate aminotransferase
LPLSAIVAKEHACVFEHGDHGGTFNGGPVVCAAALSTLSRVGSGEFLRQVRDSAQLLQEALSGVVKRFGGQEAGLGLMRRICFDAPVATALVRYCRDALPGQRKWENRGVLLNAPQPEILRFLPALNISQDEIEQLVAALTRALAATCNFRG